MNSFLRSCVRGTVKGLLRLFGGLLLTVGLIAGVAWMIAQTPQSTHSSPSPAAVSRISNAELQSIIADVYHVETSRFIQPDILWITLPSGSAVQKTCQAIANLWAHRSGLDYVSVESWSGGVRLAKATVQYGKFVTP
jgi:hypothetical protein